MSGNDLSVKKVYAAIAGVTAKLAKAGISKDRKNDQQGYKFRGIDDVYNALAPFLAEAHLCVLPRVVSRECVERTTAKGTAIFYVTVQVDFAFVSAEDGSEHHVVTYGEAMDTGDKATNKAMSAAYKYAAMQAFCIPTEGDNDADATTHEDVKPNGMKKAFASPHKPSDGAKERVDPKRQSIVADIATAVKDHLQAGNDWDAYSLIEQEISDPDERVYLWTFLDSTERRRLKTQNDLAKKTPETAGAA